MSAFFSYIYKEIKQHSTTLHSCFFPFSTILQIILLAVEAIKVRKKTLVPVRYAI